MQMQQGFHQFQLVRVKNARWRSHRGWLNETNFVLLLFRLRGQLYIQATIIQTVGIDVRLSSRILNLIYRKRWPGYLVKCRCGTA